MLSKITDLFNQRQFNKQIRTASFLVEKINAEEATLTSLTDEELREKTQNFIKTIAEYRLPYEQELEKIQQEYDKAEEERSLEEKKMLQQKIDDQKKKIHQKEQEILNTILPEAFAVVKNGCRRLVGKKVMVRGHEITWDMIPYDVQLIGGITLHQGKISEMKTGEGKTLVATLPLYLNALTKKGAHLVTVNEYLAQRDAEWMGFLFQFLGLSVGVIISQMSHEEKQQAYQADITYGTNNEFGFDYLRDNMSTSPSTEVQRGLHFAIVDEVDSILIDEARTPLIISTAAEESTYKYNQYMQYIGHLEENIHYVIDEKMKTASLNDEGIKKMEELMNVENIYTERGLSEVHHIEQALRAKACYRKDIDYIIQDGEVKIVDEFTGRILEGRRYSDGLHQAIEAKEKVEIKRESKTLATITFQNYFRLYGKLAGMTGTALTEAEEFMKIYGLDVLPIPTNKAMIRNDKADVIYKTQAGKYNALVQIIKEKYEKGQPVLVGTIAIEKSELVSSLLSNANIPHHVLNAKQHEKEAEIVAQAGKKKAVTIATNMAGRGTDIKLDEEARDTGGLCILGTERHESRRIDNQLRGRAGRQGDPGETQFFLSMEDDLLRVFGGERMKNIMEMLKIPDDMPIETGMISGAIESAQRRVEGHHFDTRKHVVQYDDVMNKQREIIYSRRKKILHKKTVRPDIIEMIYAQSKAIASLLVFKKSMQEENISEWLLAEMKAFHYDQSFDVEHAIDLTTAEDMASYISHFWETAYQTKEHEVPDENIMRDVERGVYLRMIDVLWMEHLETMQSLREAVGLHGYGQKDPLVEYKREGFIAFEKLLANIDRSVIQTLFHLEFKPQEQAEFLIKDDPNDAERLSTLQTNQSEVEGTLNSSENSAKPTVVKLAGTQHAAEHIGRNDLCPCGSGKKYKKCHGA